jgi:hypothetical protein
MGAYAVGEEGEEEIAARSNEAKSTGPLTLQETARLEVLRKEYPFESLADWLRYEEPARKLPAPPLGREAEKRLTSNDGGMFQVSDYNLRTKSLEVLHSENVAEFIRRDGAGVSRVMSFDPRPGYLPKPKYDPVLFAKLSPLSAEEEAIPASPYLKGEFPLAASGLAASPPLMPRRADVDAFHQASVQSFANPFGFGLVKSRERVAGFSSHQMGPFLIAPRNDAHPSPAPKADAPPEPFDPSKHWRIARLELVSLLKHETPRVYLSDHLPRMEELSSANAPTRALDDFETAALKLLREGEELRTSSTPNRIEMLGAVRAGNQCLTCHEVPRGTLLGAFSYELRRDPPIKIAPPPPAVVQ